MPPQQQVPVHPVQMSIIQAIYIPDSQRNPAHHPGKLVYSAQFDHERLVCLYRAMTFPFCCGLEDMARNTHYDVYTNGVVLSRPSFFVHSADCCCGRQAWGLKTFFNHTVFDSPTTPMRVCKGSCFALCGYCGKFGDQINHHSFGMNECRISGMSHFTLHGCCETYEVVFGLKEGESARLSIIINEQARLFRENPTAYALESVAAAAGASGQMKPMGTV